MASPLTHSYQYDAPCELPDSIFRSGSTEVMSWSDGIEPQTLHENPAHDPLISFAILAIITVTMFNFRNFRKLFKNLPQDLWGIRRRENAFDDSSSSLQRTFIVLILQLIVCETILLYLWFHPSGVDISPGNSGTTIGLLLALTSGYYIFQLAAYTTVGWVFADGTGFRLWLRGFNSSSAILGLCLIVPAMTALFYPSTAVTMIIISLIFYTLARIIFIFKGFRIFYHNFFSLIYFILYLCTLEIIPLFLFYTEARNLCNFQF